MSNRDFLNENDLRFYPFVDTADFSFSVGTLPRQGLTDAGFMLGLDSGFEADVHGVALYAVRVTASSTEFDFRSDAPGMANYRWLFRFPDDAAFGSSARVDAEHISTEVGDSDRGWGFLTVGSLYAVRALGPGLYSLITPPSVEAALVQSLVDTFARSINLANDARRCPAVCCPSSSSSSSGLTDTTFLEFAGLTGDIRFKEGINTFIQVNEIDNAIDIEGIIGAGAGAACEDIIIDENGFQRGEDCVDCSALAKSINGRTTSNGKLRLIGGPGITLTSFPGINLISVDVEAERLCQPSGTG